MFEHLKKQKVVSLSWKPSKITPKWPGYLTFLTFVFCIRVMKLKISLTFLLKVKSIQVNRTVRKEPKWKTIFSIWAPFHHISGLWNWTANQGPFLLFNLVALVYSATSFKYVTATASGTENCVWFWWPWCLEPPLAAWTEYRRHNVYGVSPCRTYFRKLVPTFGWQHCDHDTTRCPNTKYMAHLALPVMRLQAT